MIISIRGTSGSGKTTLVRRVKAWWGDDWKEEVENGKIIGYTSRGVFIFGPYREGLQSGGADSTKWGVFRHREYRMNYLATWARNGYHVIFEGLMESTEFHRTVAWSDICPVYAVFLDAPIEDCLAYINARRARRGIMEPVDPYQTKRKRVDIKRVHQRLFEAGIAAPWIDRETAYTYVCGLLEKSRDQV